ncbi:MAG TPA: DUF1629 domain-containing protein [Gemmatimonadaceae bacterium]|nr:DUF1629 domain-containing protein [Gemmatimonadaceae bacterium]
MPYYMLRNSPQERRGITADPRLQPPVSFQTGATITSPLPQPLVFAVDTTAQEPPADYVRYKIPVFSDRLIKAFETAGVDNLQVFPAKLENARTGETWEQFKAVNIIGLISCLAIAESRASPELPPLYSFDLADLVVEDARIGDAPLFRLAESPSVVLVSSRVGDLIMDSTDNFRGLEFRDVGSV